jgi:hypothetical protein
LCRNLIKAPHFLSHTHIHTQRESEKEQLLGIF